ncbi:hypothetical protein IV203_033747 [Nitzschia inconspicua]|uniref:Uncharacterized protein n=1 Tax=Nitzschia inconspicua TaxID=303405 RepID=A0A9K3M3F4_9STRA|nr:hypothetical protein IV203_033747 [Nitzschia inconspicua]
MASEPMILTGRITNPVPKIERPRDGSLTRPYISKKKMAINNAPIVPMPINPNRLRNLDHFFGSFAGHQKEAATTVKQVNSFNKSTSSDQFTPRDSQIMNDIANPAIIREAVEETMKLLEMPDSSDFPKFFGKE